MEDLVDHGYAMRIDYMGTVLETKQLLASQENFRLRTIVPDVMVVRLLVTAYIQRFSAHESHYKVTR